MLGVAGILAQEIVKPGVFFYSAGLPENLPNINFGGPDGKVCTCRQIGVQWQGKAAPTATICCGAQKSACLLTDS